MASLKGAQKSVKGIGTFEKFRLNAKSEINELKNLADRNKNRPDHELNARIVGVIDHISQASNPSVFLNLIILCCNRIFSLMS